jgi:hypothetical protein
MNVLALYLNIPLRGANHTRSIADEVYRAEVGVVGWSPERAIQSFERVSVNHRLSQRWMRMVPESRYDYCIVGTPEQNLSPDGWST